MQQKGTMKIIILTMSFAMKAGVERLLSDKMNYMAEHGHEIMMVTYEQGEHKFPFTIHPSIRHIDLDTRFFTLGIMSLPKRMIRILKLRRQFKQRLQKVIDEFSPDIIHTTTYCLKVADIILEIKTKAKLTMESQVSYDSVLKESDFSTSFWPLKKLAKTYDHWLFKKLNRFDRFIVLTKGDAKSWKKYLHHVTIIPNPLTLYPETIKSHAIPHNRIICAGRLESQKGFDLLIHSFATISEQCKDWNIDIFGSGTDEHMLRALITENKLEQQIQIHPATDHIFEEYQNSDFFVFSSRFEGWGLVLVEAMACGIPAVSFRCDYGPEEIISDGEDGLLVSNGDIYDLAEKILWMIRHPSERVRMGEAARKNVKKYKKEFIIQQWIELFESLLK